MRRATQLLRPTPIFGLPATLRRSSSRAKRGSLRLRLPVQHASSGLAGLAAGLLLAAPALAAAGGEPNLFESPIGWAFRWAQFLLIFGGAGYLIAKKAPPYFRGRAEALSASLAESARLKRDAERHLREAEQKLEGIEQELADLRAAAQREAAAEAERIRAATRDEAQKIERAAQAEREAAERAARMELKALAARLAVEQAEALIQRQLTPQTEAELLRSFVDNLARSVN